MILKKKFSLVELIVEIVLEIVVTKNMMTPNKM